MKIAKAPFIVFLVVLNAVPIYGVLNWGWKSFDLIFLYWLENLIIGVFMILRILIRPYRHPIELVFPLFLAPFFAVHFGGFCYVHGMFVVGLFGQGLTGALAGLEIPEIIVPLIESRNLFWPIMALFGYQMLDWVRDATERGLGSDSIMQITTSPYRRIIVLHFTILASGFALVALDEPTIGLFVLIALKTVFDLYHWNKDEQDAVKARQSGLSDKMKRKIDEFLKDPKITINGKETHFASYDEFKTSKYYGLLLAIFRMTGGGSQLKSIEAYIEQQVDDQDLDDTETITVRLD